MNTAELRPLWIMSTCNTD